MSRIHSYPKIFSLGHAAIVDLLKDPVVVEEKVDGSQFSFGLVQVSREEYGTPEPQRFELQFRSRGQALNAEAPEKMFARGVEAVKVVADQLHPGWIYRGEYLDKPKHNTLAYDRTPRNHVIIFDINDNLESYLSPEAKRIEAERIGFETVPVLLEGALTSYDAFSSLLQRQSILGGQKIEGVVIKNYKRFGKDGKALMGKFVSEEFKEIHGADWKERNPAGKDVLTLLADKYRTPARWEKAIQHLKERGQLQNAPQDIGPLFKEVNIDTLEECGAEIKEALFKWAWAHVSRRITAGLPEWYKERLAKQQFESTERAHVCGNPNDAYDALCAEKFDSAKERS